MTNETDVTTRKDMSSIQVEWKPGAKAETRTCIDTALTYTFPISYKALICVAVLCYKNVNSYTYIASEESV